MAYAPRPNARQAKAQARALRRAYAHKRQSHPDCAVAVLFALAPLAFIAALILAAH